MFHPFVVVLALLLGGGRAEAGSLDGYATKCQIKQLAAEWKVSPGAAKRELKRQIAKGDKSYAESLYSADYMPANCRFSETGFTRYDAEQLAAFWSTDVPGAMRLVEKKFANGDGMAVWDVLKYGYTAVDSKHKVSEDAADFERFATSTYHYCDARMVAEVWGYDVFGSKVMIGRKLSWGDPQTLMYLESSVAQGRAQASAAGRPCEFVELNYTYDDATALASVWGVGVDQAKLRIAEMVTNGRDGEIRQQLSMRRGG